MKDNYMKIKTLLAAVIFSVSIIFPLTVKTDKAFAEAEYAIGLCIDTIDCPRNWIIGPNYTVRVPVRVSNNPGITYLAFLAKQTGNLYKDIYAGYNKNIIPFNGVASSYWPEFENGAKFTTVGDGYYDLNDVICYIVVTVPDSANVGDFYGLEFAPEFNYDGKGFCFKKDGIRYTIENFGSLTNGGVRIVEDAPLYRIETDYITEPNNEGAASSEPAPQDQEQPQQNEEQAAPNSDNSSESGAENSSNSDKENAAESTTASTTEEASESKTTTSTSKTTSSTAKASTSKSRKTTTVLTEIQSETAETSEASQEKTDKEEVSLTEKKRSHIPEFVAGGILAAGVVIFIILQKMTKKK